MDWQALLKTIAPWIGTAIAGPLGGMALTAAAGALGISQPTTDKLKAALAGITPEQSLALKQADAGFQETMTKLGYDHIEKLEALVIEDRKDARAMQVATKSRIPGALAIAITIGFFGLLGGMTAGLLSVKDSSTMTLMLGTLSTAWVMVVSYYFGSSAGSARKDELAAGATPRT